MVMALAMVLVLTTGLTVFVSGHAEAASQNDVLWTDSTRFGTQVTLKYGTTAWGYFHIHIKHGLNGESGILALGQAVQNANVRKQIVDSDGNPTGYWYFGTVYGSWPLSNSWVRVKISVTYYGSITSAYPVLGSQSSYGVPSQFPWFFNNWVWSTKG